MTEQQMTPQMAVGLLASAIKSGEPFTEQCEQAVAIAMAALSHAEGEAPEIEPGTPVWSGRTESKAGPKSRAIPDVPDLQMLEAGEDALARGLKNFPDNMTQVVNNVWEDMHEAAPTAPQVAVPEGWKIERFRDGYNVVAPNGALAYIGPPREHDYSNGPFIRMFRALLNDLLTIPTIPTAPTAPAPDEREPRLLGYTSQGELENQNDRPGPAVTWIAIGNHTIPVYVGGVPDEREIAAKALDGMADTIAAMSDESENSVVSRALYRAAARCNARAGRLRAGKEGE